MKRSVTFLFVFVCSLVFGQSAKKLHKKLLAEFALEQQKQDSSFLVFTKTKTAFDSVRSLFNEKRDQLSEGERYCKKVLSKNAELSNQLTQLGVNTTGLITSEEAKLLTVPDYRDFVRPLKEPLKTKAVFDKVSNRLYLEGMKLKEQNELLSAKIKEYGDYAKYNFSRLQDVEMSLQQVVVFLPKMDSMYAVYKELAQALKTKRAKLEEKRDALRENYIQKGPDGFPEAYRRVFYDAFPPPEVETIDGATESYGVVGDIDRYEMVVPPPPPPVEENPIYDYVEEPASFPGGNQAMQEFISKNLRYPEKFKEANITGKVFLKFVVSGAGEISDIKVVKGIPDCKECDLEAIRVVKLMPAWIPGKLSGKAVKSVYNLPIKFVLF